jgi:N-acetylglutamate synthase-like GNAT family acetyltransferase
MATFIRQYIASDKAACIEAFSSNLPKYFTIDELGDFERFLDRIVLQNPAANKSASWTLYYVVVHDNIVIGCGGLGDKDGTNVISLAWGLVHFSYHKMGFGLQLLLHRLSVKEKLYPDGQLVLDTTQHSAPFFEKYGFTTTKIIENGYVQGMHRYDMVYSK